MARQQFADLDLRSVQKVTNSPNATASGDLVPLGQLQALLEGNSWKDDVRVSTQGNINLSAPGSAIDGVTLSNGDRFLVRQQTSVPANGIYVFNGAASAATRATDASTFAELEGAVVIVKEGTDAGTGWRQTQVGGVIGTNDIVWTAAFTAAPSASETTAGLIEIATQVETDAGSDDARAITPLKLATWSGRKFKFTANFGDGSSTQFTHTHNFNTRAVNVEVYRNSGNYDTIECDVERTSANAVRLTLGTAPTTNEFTVNILA